MSLWRKRKTSDNLAPNVVANVHHNEQNPDHLVNILNNLSIQSKDLSIKSWVGLSEKDINELKYNLPDLYYWVDVVRATEKRLKEKNT